MAESAASRAASSAELPFGVRAAEFFLSNLISIAVLTVGAATLATLIALMIPRPYVDSAVVEVGVRFGSEPLENPIKAGWRVRGALLDAARELGVELDSTIKHRREEKTNELTRLIDVTVRADTASTARTILDRGLARLLTDHQEAHLFEREILREQLEALETAASRLGTTIRDTPLPMDPDPTREANARAELDALNARLFDLHRSIQSARSVLSDVRTPPTRMVARVAKVEQQGARAVIWCLAGALFGLVAGVAIAAARFAMRTGGRT